MALFNKKLGPIFLKEESSTQTYIQKLEALYEKANGEVKQEIEKQLLIAKQGLVGENNIAFELKNSGLDLYILHDVYLECDSLSAQIDYLIIGRHNLYLIECKNLIGNIEIDSNGNFIRSYYLHSKKIKEGIYSPITQSERHLNVLKQIYLSNHTSFVGKSILENWIFKSFKSVVVLANPKTYVNMKFAPKTIKSNVIRADQLIQYIKDSEKESKFEASTNKDMLEQAQYLLSLHKENKADYIAKYEAQLSNSDCLDKDEIRKKLKQYRLNQSRFENIKPYYIFNDAQMESLIDKMPKTKEELLHVSGFGNVKVEKYGNHILDILHNKN